MSRDMGGGATLKRHFPQRVPLKKLFLHIGFDPRFSPPSPAASPSDAPLSPTAAVSQIPVPPMPPPLPAPLIRSASGLLAFQQGQFTLQAVAEEEGEEEEDEEEDDKDGEEASVQIGSREDDIKREKVGIPPEKVPKIEKNRCF